MRCQIKAESLLFPTMYKSQKVTCSGFCVSGSHIFYGKYCPFPPQQNMLLQKNEKFEHYSESREITTVVFRDWSVVRIPVFYMYIHTSNM